LCGNVNQKIIGEVVGYVCLTIAEMNMKNK